MYQKLLEADEEKTINLIEKKWSKDTNGQFTVRQPLNIFKDGQFH